MKRKTRYQAFSTYMFQVRPWQNVILHLDGDAFFASVFQATNPKLKDKPVVTGSERGLATAVSYEARRYGVRRGMLTWQIKRICPQCIILPSDYELYDLFSQQMFNILKSFSPLVEEYSIDEAFADLKGLRRPFNMSYAEIGQAIKNKIENSLGITVSVGISVTKSLAKLASSFRKPSGLTVIPGTSIKTLLAKTAISDVWGIGENTSAYLQKFGVKTALDFTLQKESFVKNRLTKPFFEIWQELQGEKVYEINSQSKQSYKGITRSQTFTPSTNDKNILWARLLNHVEDAFAQARQFHYLIGKITLYLKTQDFHYHVAELKLVPQVAYPYLIRDKLHETFNEIWKKNISYRTAGCHITDFQIDEVSQMALFSTDNALEKKLKKIYPLYEAKKIDFGSTFFDKKMVEENKPKPKLKLPVISI